MQILLTGIVKHSGLFTVASGRSWVELFGYRLRVPQTVKLTVLPRDSIKNFLLKGGSPWKSSVMED
jgi:hypothetical protein